ncbi:MAG: 50S ribosomal protein L28 [bacterium]
MTKKCAICGKGSKMVWRRVKFHQRYNPTIKRKQLPNLQWFAGPAGKRILVCAKCIKAAGKKK